MKKRPSVSFDDLAAALREEICALREETFAHLARTDAAITKRDAAIVELIAEVAKLRQRPPVLSDIDDDLDGDMLPWPTGKWVKLKDAARRSGFSESGIREMIKRGLVKRYKRGGLVFVDMDTMPLKK